MRRIKQKPHSRIYVNDLPPLRDDDMSDKVKSATAWAAISKRSGKVLRDLGGHYAIYTHHSDANLDCPIYGRVGQVRIREIKKNDRE